MLFRNVITGIPGNADLPVVREHLRYEYPIGSGLESLVTLLNGDDFLLTKQVGKGKLYLLSVPLASEFSNFTTHALFVPVMYGAAVQGTAGNRLAYSIGKDNVLGIDQPQVTEAEKPFLLVSESNNYSFIPGQREQSGKLLLDVYDGIITDGFYDLVLDDTVYHVFAYNYDRDESQMMFLDNGDLNSLLPASGIRNFNVVDASLSNSAEVAKVLQKENRLWKLFIIFALLMLLAETLMLRLWK